MQIKSMFSKDINRSINGVVKVFQDDELSIQQELSEYVVTRELQKHFAAFFDAYDRAIDTPTDKIGVWISGFFGSGKSHFLKMLSYLLRNDNIAGIPAVDYFDGKIDDPFVWSRVKRATDVETESILFNIDTKGGQWKSGDTSQTALLRTFERVFFEHCGFYGEDLKLAKLEKHIDDRGKTAEFRAAFEEVNGDEWVNARSSYAFFEDDIIEVLQSVMGMSETAAQHWFDGSEDDVIAPDTFAQMVCDYAKKREQETGNKFRLLFMVDEVGQYIGSDVTLMLNLQTLVEEFGTRGQGRVWVMVTSQEALDEITMIVGDDFSKIQGRFNTRLSLSSSSVDEVIKMRILDKNAPAQESLRAQYETQSTILKNVFTFVNSRADLIGYKTEEDFIASYPFANYQFKLLPDVMTEIRKHGVKAQHMSTGERSMLSAFQESAQCVQEKESTTLVPFWRFFDTLSKDLEHGIIQIIDRAQRAAEDSYKLEEIDAQVLKLLYLVRYVNGFKTNINNIAILMVEDINTDMVQLREDIKASLERLESENYISRSGDCYSFLTDEEQEISRAIANTNVDNADILAEIKKIIYEGVFPDKKYKRSVNDFPLDRYVDDSQYSGNANGMKLNIITLAHELSDANDAMLNIKSANEALIVMSTDVDYYASLRKAAQITNYVKGNNTHQFTETQRAIVANKRKDATDLRNEAKEAIEHALLHARVSVNQATVNVRTNNAKDFIQNVLENLVDAVFTKAGYIDAPVTGDDEIIRIINGAWTERIGTEAGNARAEEEINNHLTIQANAHQSVCMGDIIRKYQQAPYGWREIDIAAVVASLVYNQRAILQYGGETIELAKIKGYLRGKQADSTVVKQRVRVSDVLMKRARNLAKDFCDDKNIPTDEDSLVKRIKDQLNKELEYCRGLLANEYAKDGKFAYPGQKIVEDGIHTFASVLKEGNDSVAFLTAFTKAEDALLDYAEDSQQIKGFFPNQQRLFDESADVVNLYVKESTYMSSDLNAQNLLNQVKSILESNEPYKKIKDLNQLNTELKAAHKSMVVSKQIELLSAMEEAKSEVHSYAEDLITEINREKVRNALERADSVWMQRKNDAHKMNTASDIDTLRSQITSWIKTSLIDLDRASAFVPVAASSKNQRDDGEREAKPVVLPSIAKLDRTKVCPTKRFTSEGEIDEYVENIREQLLKALEENDAVRLS